MPKRAVMVSFELWKDWITQGFKSGGLECTRGIPENAVLVQTFLNQHGAVISPELVAVFESPDFEPLKDGEYTVACPDGNRLPVFGVEFTSREFKEEYKVISWCEGFQERKISIKSMGHSTVLFDWESRGTGRFPWIPDESCKYDVEFLC